MAEASEVSLSIAPPGPVSREQVVKAVRALLTWIQKQKTKQKKAELVEEEASLQIVVALKNIPAQQRTNGHRIPLPHSLYPLGEGKEVCLIVKDEKDESAEGKRTHKAAKERLLAEGSASGVTKIIGVKKLRSKYGPHEAKRQLCGSYDLFLADDRIICTLPKLLGKTFFKKKKHPIPVDLRGVKEWSSRIRQACDSTYLYLGTGPCSVVRTAWSNQSEDEIVDNVLAVIAGVGQRVPKKWKNIKSLHLKATDSVSLPLYVAEPDVPTKIASK